MFGQRKFMTWNPAGKCNGGLHVMDDKGIWRSYKQLPKFLKAPNYNVPNGSDGYATMQVLLKNGWQIVNGADYGGDI